jgi:hypothetical protein
MIDKLKLTKEQKAELLKQLNIVKGTVFNSQMNYDANLKVMQLLKLSKENVEDTNTQLEKQITLEGMLSDNKGGTDKVTKEKAVTKEKIDQLKYERLLIEMRLTGIEQEDAIRSARINQLKKDRANAVAADPNNEVTINKTYALEIEKVWNEHAENIKAIEENRTESMRKFSEERTNIIKNERDEIRAAGEEYAAMVQKMIDVQPAKLGQKQADAITSITDSVIGLGQTRAQYIKDEKQRVKVEQGLALVQVLITQGVVLAQMSLAQIKADPYTYVPRLIAAAAAIVGTFVTAISSINQANSVQAYAQGTDYHKGGAAIVGEGGQPEMITVAGRNTWITEPTYIPNLPTGASVTPLSDMKQESNMNDIWLEKLYNKQGGNVQIDVSGNLMARFKKDSKSIYFANKLFYIKN